MLVTPLAASINSDKDIILCEFDPGVSKPGTKKPRPGEGELLWLRVLRLLRCITLVGTEDEVDGFGEFSAIFKISVGYDPMLG